MKLDHPRMAVTHDDLLPKRRSTELGSKMGVVLMVATILCGLCSFILCLIAESTRSEVEWLDNGKEEKKECAYSGSGKTPLVCAAAAFLVLAVAMVVQHMHVLIAVSKSPHTCFSPSKSLTFQAAFFFVSTWVCFAVGEILLLIGLSVESGHLSKWASPRESCVVIKEGLFCGSGILALATVFLAAGLYLTAVHAERVFEKEESVRREVLETYRIHSSPPRSPPLQPMPPPIPREDPVIRANHLDQHLSFSWLLRPPSALAKLSC